MSLTKTKIANQALQLIGARKITDFDIDDGTPNWDAVQLVYDSIRDEVLVEHPWSFAQRRVALLNISNPSTTPDAWVTSTSYEKGDYVVESSINYTCTTDHTSGTFNTDYTTNGYWTPSAGTLPMTEDNMSVVYAFPTSFLRAFKISANVAYHIENLLINSTATQVILSEATGLKMIYIYQNDDPTMYFPSFTNALVHRLAHELTLYINESNTTKRNLMEEYTKIWLPKAQSLDSQHQGTPEQVSQYAWDQERMVTSGSVFPPFPGAQTWHSVWYG